MRRAARIDSNQPEIVAAFLARGFSVLNVSQLKNCCDLIVAKYGMTFAIEIKDGSLPPSSRKLTPGEQKFRDGWQGKWCLIESVEDIETLTFSF